MSANTQQPWAIVVGAGPAGLLLALRLAQQNIAVCLLDMAESLDAQPRATHYASPAVYELARAEVLDEIREAGFDPKVVSFRRLDENRTRYATMDAAVLGNHPDRMACLPLNDLSRILLARLEKQPTASVRWQCKVVGLGQDEMRAWLDLETPTGKERLFASYIAGCDGANSQVRRSLFGDWEFPGRTWNEQIVATNMYFPFERYDYDDSNFFIDKTHWHMVAKITKEGLWRVTYGEIPGLTAQELRDRHPAKMKAILPGADDWRLANFSPYKVHQRLAPRMRVGRFCLAADAAHLCNPFGGLGLTGGIVDVGGLADCLIGIHRGLADEAILDRYDEVRRQKYCDFINPISSENLERMWQEPEGLLERDAFLQLCAKGDLDPEVAIQNQLGLDVIKHDFTQYYRALQGDEPVDLHGASDSAMVTPRHAIAVETV